MKEIFTKSDKFKEEYCATIVKVGELKDIENSDNLKQAIVDGFSIVVNKNDVKEGDYTECSGRDIDWTNGFYDRFIKNLDPSETVSVYEMKLIE